MLQEWLIIAVALGYLGLLFAIAHYGDHADRRAGGWARLFSGPTVYALSIAVFCTSWTFYGSVGRAASTGVGFLGVYLGPVLVFLVGLSFLKRLVKTAREQHITSISDLISSRFGGSQKLAGLVTIVAVIGIMPYISLQLKAVTSSYEVLSGYPAIVMPHGFGETPWYSDAAFYVTLTMGLFAILFGTRSINASEQHHGMVAAVAFESVVKLVAFVAVGVFVTYSLYNGWGDLTTRIAAMPDKAPLLNFSETIFSIDFGATVLLSAAAIFCLPRQFQVIVVENRKLSHLNKARWLFPLYLIAINVFVLPIAFGGLAMFNGMEVDADTYVLTLPMMAENPYLALFAFIGGLSAATGMVIVATIALSTMVCNDLVVPLMLRYKPSVMRQEGNLVALLKRIRRLAILSVLLLSYFYVRQIGDSYALVSIGLVSFAAAFQFMPPMVLGLYWRRPGKKAALTGLIGGFAVWAYTLLLPSFARSGWLPIDFVTYGPWGIDWLRPYALFGMDGFSTITHTMFWSLVANVGGFSLVAYFSHPSEEEQERASRFVGSGGGKSGQGPRGSAMVTLGDLISLTARFMNRQEAEHEFEVFAKDNAVVLNPKAAADDRFIRFSERLLAGVIGAASARVMIAAACEKPKMEVDSLRNMLQEASDAILSNRGILHDAVESISQGVSVYDEELNLVLWNSRFVKVMDLPKELVRVGASLLDIVEYNARRGEYGPGEPREHVQKYMRLASGGEGDRYERERPDGSVIEVILNRLPEGGVVTTISDITDRRRAEQAMRQSEARFRSVAETAHDAIVTANSFGDIITWNKAARNMFGYNQEAVVSQSLLMLFPEEIKVRYDNDVELFLRTGARRAIGKVVETQAIRADGEVFPCELSMASWDQREGVFYSLFVRDITKRKRAESQIHHMANHDVLTGLPNRSLFMQCLEESIKDAARYDRGLALCFLDLDHFKEVNDTLGHMAGDKLLFEAAQRLKKAAGEDDLVARFGGDEFAVLIPNISRRNEVSKMANRIIEAISRPFQVEGHQIHSGASVGITVYPNDGMDAETLLRNGDMAMYAAKERGRNGFNFFRDEMNVMVQQRKVLLNEMREGLEQEAFFMHYQPQVSSDTGKVVGMEALCRWRREDGTIENPGRFIELAEQSGLILPLGEQVLYKSCAQAAAWRRSGLPNLSIAVNVSSEQLRNQDLTGLVKDVLAETGLPASALELEITESVMMENMEAATDMMDALNAEGVSFAIDDFGTGYSSLAYLKRFPVKKIKIDHSFIHDIALNEDNAAIAAAIIKLGHSLGLTVLAEGVENETQRKFLRQQGCDLIQGFYFSRPLEADAFRRWVMENYGGPKEVYRGQEQQS